MVDLEDLQIVLDAARQHWRNDQWWRPVHGPAYFESNLARAENRHKLSAAIQRLVDASSVSREGVHWQPIETAPKDSTPLWMVEDGRQSGYLMAHQFVGIWCSDKRYECGGCWRNAYRDRVESPTHWMPLPDPPASFATICHKA